MTAVSLDTMSLSAQIDQTEQRLLNRRRLVNRQNAELRSRVHDQITSPAVLVSAASLGFLLGESTQDYVSDPDHPWMRMLVRSMPWMYSLL
jgi:hypothetical protein